MSLILCLESENGEKVSVQIQPDDDFQTFLSRASSCVGKDVDISTIVGDEAISLNDNVYQFMVRVALNEDCSQQSTIDHEIIDASNQHILPEQREYITNDILQHTDANEDTLIGETGDCCLESYIVYQVPTDNVDDNNENDLKMIKHDLNENRETKLTSTPKILNSQYYYKQEKLASKNNAKKLKTYNLSNKCCFCGVMINCQMFPNFIFDKKDQNEMRNSKHRRNRGVAKVVCEICIQNDFVKCDEIPKNFDSESFLVLRNNVQYFYKRINSNKTTSSRNVLNAAKENIGIGDNINLDDFEIKSIGGSLFKIANNEDDRKAKDSVSYTCRLCKAILDIPPISHCLDHISSRSEGLLFPCVLCEYGFTSFQELKNHVNCHNGNKQKNLSSNFDQKSSVADSNSDRIKNKGNGLKLLTKLLKRHHEKNYVERLNGAKITEKSVSVQAGLKESESDTESGIWIIQAGVEDASDEEDNSLVCYQCDSCRREFDSMASYSSHTCPPQLEAVSKILTSRNVISHQSVNKKVEVIGVGSEAGQDVGIAVCDQPDIPGQHQCQMCQKSFHTKIRLQFHMRYIHIAGSDPSTLRCSLCPDLKFKNEGSLYDHIHFTHPKNKKFVCPVDGCAKQFNIKGGLKTHLSCHSGERTHACDVCDKLFFDKQTLNDHKVTHLQVKPYQCHICHKYLNRKSRLRMHILNHQSQPSRSQILACALCNETFSNADIALNHLNSLGHCTSEQNDEQFNEELVDDPNADFPGESINNQQTSLVTETGGLFEDIDEKKYILDKELENNFEDLKMANKSKMANCVDDKSEVCDSLLEALPKEARQIITVVEVDKVFRCEYCEKTFWRQEALNIHKSEHKGQDNPYTCHICRAQFSTYSRCTTHKTTHGFYRDTNKRSQTDSSVQPISEDSFPIVRHFSCEVCNKSYLHWTYLQVHRKLKHSDDVHMYKCVTCGDEFPNSWGVAYHRKKVHGQNTGSAPPDEVPNKNIERIQYSCSECGVILSTKARLFLHKRSAHPVSTSPSKNDMFACSKCNKRYLTKVGLQGHFKKQHDKSNSTQIHKCQECDKTFINAGGLNNHVRRVHMKEMKYECPKCDAGFYSMCDLKSHMRRHSGEKPFPCHLCGRRFRTKGMRNQHIRIHSGERPYKCDLCGVGFRRAYALRTHRLTHAPHTRSLQCPMCPRLFRLKAELNTHMRHIHCLDPATYTIQNTAHQQLSDSVTIVPIPSSCSEQEQNRKIFSYKNQTTVVDHENNSPAADHQNTEESCFFTTIFENAQNRFIDNIQQVEMSDSGSSKNLANEEIICDGNLITTASQIVIQEENSSSNLCIIAGDNLNNEDIVLNGNVFSNHYILNEELSEQSKSLVFKETSSHKILEVGYLTRLITLNNVNNMSEIKLVNIENGMVNKQVNELSNENLNDLYGSNVVIDKVEINTDISMEDSAIEKNDTFVIDWQENEEVNNNEKSIDNRIYFSEAQ